MVVWDKGWWDKSGITGGGGEIRCGGIKVGQKEKKKFTRFKC